MMTHTPSANPANGNPTSVCMLRWLLRSGAAALACEVGMNADRTFDVRVSPSSAPQDGIVERHTGLVSAMKRHAEIANALRDSGWQVAERAASRQVIAA
jgi:hypothetical protein